jgi:hypothetical protein
MPEPTHRDQCDDGYYYKGEKKENKHTNQLTKMNERQPPFANSPSPSKEDENAAAHRPPDGTACDRRQRCDPLDAPNSRRRGQTTKDKINNKQTEKSMP